MKKKLFVKGCIIFMLLCVTGCGASDAGQEVTEDTEEVTQEVTEDTEEVTENLSEEPDTENSEITEDVNQQEAVTQDLGELSDDLYSYQISINGEIYQAPMDVEMLVERGWELDGDIEGELDAYTLDPLRTFCNEGYEIEASIINETDSPKPYSACKVVKISVSLFYNDDNEITVIMPKGIQAGVSTVEDVKAAYGEPTSFSESDGTAIADYEIEFATKCISFIFSENKLMEIDIENEDF